jgi:hypothetical protein
MLWSYANSFHPDIPLGSSLISLQPASNLVGYTRAPSSPSSYSGGSIHVTAEPGGGLTKRAFTFLSPFCLLLFSISDAACRLRAAEYALPALVRTLKQLVPRPHSHGTSLSSSTIFLRWASGSRCGSNGPRPLDISLLNLLDDELAGTFDGYGHLLPVESSLPSV